MFRLPPSPDFAELREVVGRLLTGLIISRRFWIAAGAFVITLAIGTAAFYPLVRSRIEAEASRRRFVISVGTIRPGFFSVSLGDVRLGLEGVAGVAAHFDNVRVDVTPFFSVRQIVSRGGEIQLEGEPEDLISRVRNFRAQGQTGDAQPATGSPVPIEADGVALLWKFSEGEIVGSDLRVARQDEAIRFHGGRVLAKYRRGTLEIIEGDLELAPDGVLRRAAALSASVGEDPLPKMISPIAKKPAAVAEPDPPPLPAARNAAVPSSNEPLLPFPDLHSLRNKIGMLGQTLERRVPEGSKVDVAGLSVKIDVEGEAFAFGPGPFTMERHANAVRLTFRSEKGGAQSTPLALDAELPLGSHDVSIRLSGGPVSLALLGVKEGTKGLFDVDRGTVAGKGLLVLSAPGDSLTFDGHLALRSLSMKQPRIASEPLRGIDLAVTARGLLDDAGHLRLDDASLDMGAIHLRTHGRLFEEREHFGAALSLEVAPAACQSLLESVPQGLLPTLRGSRMTGMFGATSHVVFDSAAIDKLVLDYAVEDKCQLQDVSSGLARDRFSGPFTYRTYHPDGSQGETTTGPGTDSWTDLDAISPYLVVAVLTTEDGAFYRHRGFNHGAIKSSVAANLKARRFVRGASTITMQLAKNLFLSREKTLSRKVEEVILADYLEQICRKDDLMELYLNVVEFGPDVYGVTKAADYYFGRKPEELNLSESFFLASLMPSPLRYGKQREKGQVSPGWTRYLQKLMEIAAKNGKLSPAELAEGLSYELVFYHPGQPRPEPRKVAPRSPRDGLDRDDAAWSPL